MTQVTEKIKTGPYKWTRDLYEKLAKRHGCSHQFEFVRLPQDGNTRKTEYLQVITGSDDKVALIEREAEEIRADIESRTRKVFPGGRMFSASANEHRAKLVEELP